MICARLHQWCAWCNPRRLRTTGQRGGGGGRVHASLPWQHCIYTPLLCVVKHGTSRLTPCAPIVEGSSLAGGPCIALMPRVLLMHAPPYKCQASGLGVWVMFVHTNEANLSR